MTNKERFMTALSGGIPDMVPIWELAINEPCIIEIAKRFTDKVPDLKWLHEMTPMDLLDMFNTLVLVVNELDFDGVTAPVLSMDKYLGNGVVLDKFGIKHHISEHGMPMSFEGPINSIQDLKTYKPPVIDETWTFSVNMAKQAVGDKRAVLIMILDVFDMSWSLRGKMEHLLMDFALDPELAHGVTSLATDLCIQIAERAIDAGADVIASAGDLAMTESTIISPKHFNEFLKPYYKKFTDAIHARGAKIIKHSDGNLWPIMDDLLEIGFDGLHPVQPQSMDIGEVKARCSGNTCVVGNIDCIDLLCRGTVEEVEETVKETIRIAAPGGGYILSSSNTIHPDVNPDNAIAMYRAARKYGSYDNLPAK